MTSQNRYFDTFYEDQIQARRGLGSREQIWSRFTEPTVLVSTVLLILGIIYQLCGTSPVVEQALVSCRRRAWDGFVFITPASLLHAVDSRMHDPSIARQMTDLQLNTHAAKSDAMRRILGLDRGGGVMASMWHARTRAMSATGSAFGLKFDTDRPAGLGNRDNSCYQNSILQGLAALRPLPDYLSTYLQASEEAPSSSKDVAHTLRSLLSSLNDASNNGRTLWTPSLLKSMSTWTQQDAQEYYSKIIDDIDKGVAKVAAASQRSKGLEAERLGSGSPTSQQSDDSGYQSMFSSVKVPDTSPFRNPLEGLLAQRVACVQCGYTDGLSMIPFNCLTLSLGLDSSSYDLFDRLDAYCHVEAIEGVECPKCTLLKAQRLLTKLIERMQTDETSEHQKQQLVEPQRRLEAVEAALEDDIFDDKMIRETCKISAQSRVTTTKTKQIVVARPPKSLAIHVNRSVFDPSTFNMMKNSAPVRFPTTLDLGPWCLGSAEALKLNDDGQVDVTSPTPDEEHWLSDPRLSMVAGDLQPSRVTGPIYELRAVVTHYGRHENGHYICYRRHPRPKQTSPESPLTREKPIEESQAGDSLEEETKSAERVNGENGHDTAEGSTDTAAETKDALMDGQAAEGEEISDWWRLSDHNVTKVEDQTLMSLSSGVFMLFYDCIDPEMSLRPETPAPQDTEVVSSTTEQHTAGSGSVTADGDTMSTNSSPQSQPLTMPDSLGDATKLPAKQEGEESAPKEAADSEPTHAAKEMMEANEADK